MPVDPVLWSPQHPHWGLEAVSAQALSFAEGCSCCKKRDHKNRKNITVGSVSWMHICLCQTKYMYLYIWKYIQVPSFAIMALSVQAPVSTHSNQVPQSRNLPALLSYCLWEKDFGVSPSSETGKFITCVHCVDKPKLLQCTTGQTPLLLRSEPWCFLWFLGLIDAV